MKLIMYGTRICPDCVEAIELLDQHHMNYEYRDFNESTSNLKEFLALRDTNPIFSPVRAAGGIGIPLFVLADGKVTLDVKDIIEEKF